MIQPNTNLFENGHRKTSDSLQFSRESVWPHQQPRAGPLFADQRVVLFQFREVIRILNVKHVTQGAAHEIKSCNL